MTQESLREGPVVRLGLAVLVVSWTIIVVTSAFTAARFSALGPAAESTIGLDFEAFVAAGTLVAEGAGDFIYDPDSAAFASLANVGFVYPPWFAVAMIPWTWPPLPWAFAAWTVLGLVALVAGLRRAGALDLGVVVGALVALPGTLALVLGQSSFFHIAIVAGATLAAAPAARARGWMLGLASWKPHLLLGFGLLGAASPRDWLRTLVSTAGTAVLLLAVGAVVIPGSVRAWFEFVWSSVDVLATALLEASLPGAVALLLGSLSPSRYIVVAGAALLVIPLGVRVLRASRAGGWERSAFALSLGLVFVPHVVVYDLLLLVIPLGGLAKGRFRRDVIIAGTVLAMASTVGPWLNLAQYRATGRAIDVVFVGLAAFTYIAYRWTISGEPIWNNSPLIDGPSP